MYFLYLFAALGLLGCSNEEATTSPAPGEVKKRRHKRMKITDDDEVIPAISPPIQAAPIRPYGQSSPVTFKTPIEPKVEPKWNAGISYPIIINQSNNKLALKPAEDFFEARLHKVSPVQSAVVESSSAANVPEGGVTLGGDYDSDIPPLMENSVLGQSALDHQSTNGEKPVHTEKAPNVLLLKDAEKSSVCITPEVAEATRRFPWMSSAMESIKQNPKTTALSGVALLATAIILIQSKPAGEALLVLLNALFPFLTGNTMSAESAERVIKYLSENVLSFGYTGTLLKNLFTGGAGYANSVVEWAKGLTCRR